MSGAAPACSSCVLWPLPWPLTSQPAAGTSELCKSRELRGWEAPSVCVPLCPGSLLQHSEVCISLRHQLLSSCTLPACVLTSDSRRDLMSSWGLCSVGLQLGSCSTRAAGSVNPPARPLPWQLCCLSAFLHLRSLFSVFAFPRAWGRGGFCMCC